MIPEAGHTISILSFLETFPEKLQPKQDIFALDLLTLSLQLLHMTAAYTI